MNDFYTGLMFLLMGVGVGSCTYLTGKNEADIEKTRLHYQNELAKNQKSLCDTNK